MKTCILCSEMKPLDAFYKHPKMADGRLNRCKECHKAAIRKNRADKHEYYLEFDRQRAMLPHRVQARAEYIKTDAGKMAKARAINSYQDRFPEKKAATSALNNAIRSGRMKRADACWHCGNDKRIEGHHWDYSRPLDVIWLCHKCHVECHRLTDELRAATA